MERLLMQDLINWKDNPNRKPLVVQGVRQCGKTFLIQEFAKRYYSNVIYYRFDKDAKIKTFFEQDLDPERIIKDLGIARGKKIEPNETLIIFNEIDYKRRLRSFCYEKQTNIYNINIFISQHISNYYNCYNYKFVGITSTHW